jgi:hypothetical protein
VKSSDFCSSAIHASSRSCDCERGPNVDTDYFPKLFIHLRAAKSVELLGEVANRNWQVRESNLDLGISVLGFTALGAA